MSNFMRNNVATTNSRDGSRHAVIVETRYVKLDENTYGWLRIALADGGFDFLCEYTKVTMVKTENGRTHFKVADGWSASVGKTASLSEENAAKHLVKSAPANRMETVRIKYGPRKEEVSPFKGRLLQQWATLNVRGQAIRVTLNSLWNGAFFPIPQGIHRIMAPDTSHANISTRGYRDSFPGRIKANDVWFPIELDGKIGNSSRYVHIGHLSEGCVTVYDIERWNIVYDFLISNRLSGSNGRYVALLEVTI
ncbi:hypothetical protein CTP10_R13500 [Cupriavidus sp. P-10]|uniref:hypothetical protein n=1 Tax=unclassified Cupriavidus TaxID=2640874 RepID=UPI000E2EF005|nr:MULTISPECIES: hypothetical protein [unclassified Cupriavidus]BDB24005.1 hypothetical protein CTP10_R13500 [Cupriavidus sp. P-10]